MGGKGKTAPVPQNDQIVQMQQQQAAQAKEANAERTARLQQGMAQITDIFGGHPADATMLDLSGITSGAVPALPGYTTTNPATVASGSQGSYVWDDTNNTWVPAGSPGAGGGASLAGGYSWGALPDSGGSTQYGIWDPSHNLVTAAASPAALAAQQIWYGGSPDAPTVGGIPSDFYTNFNQSILDYYQPQEAQQYTDARSNLGYTLARAGQLNSSTADMDVAKLSQEDQMNQAQIASQADQQTANLRTQIANDQQQAINQLYSTEDPSVAANAAQNMVANAQLTTPDLNPAGAMFAPIYAGVGNAISGFTNPYSYITTGSQQAAPKAPSASQGVAGQGQ